MYLIQHAGYALTPFQVQMYSIFFKAAATRIDWQLGSPVIFVIVAPLEILCTMV